ncbi:hypothetical protein CPC16_001848, partial [Podila verticillata]
AELEAAKPLYVRKESEDWKQVVTGRVTHAAAYGGIPGAEAAAANVSLFKSGTGHKKREQDSMERIERSHVLDLELLNNAEVGT